MVHKNASEQQWADCAESAVKQCMQAKDGVINLRPGGPRRQSAGRTTG